MKQIVIDFTNIFEFKNISNYNKYIDLDSKVLIRSLIQSNLSVSEILNSTVLLNHIGVTLFGITCIKDHSGKHIFNVPNLDYKIDEDLSVAEKAGDLIRLLVERNKDKNIYLNNNTKIILYNTEISVESWDNKNIQLIENIIFNVVTLYLIRKLKR